MKAVFIRHATRSQTQVEDCPLNSIGLGQAQDLLLLLAPHGPLPEPTDLLASPKKRAQQTLSPLAARFGITIEIDSKLDLRHSNESRVQFADRVLAILEKIEASYPNDSVVYVCSHVDWLEEAFLLMNSNLPDSVATTLSTAEFRIFSVNDGVWNYQASGSSQPKR